MSGESSSETGPRLRAIMTGALFGVVTFAVLAALWRLGDRHLAATTAETVLVLAVLGVAAMASFGRPAQLRKIRLQSRRTGPMQRWTEQEDTPTVVALCIGGPVVLAAATAVALFN